MLAIPFFVFFLFFIGIRAASAQAQPQPPPEPQAPASQVPMISVRSNVVLVPAIVTNKAGVHVGDLTQDDFTLLENGQRQKIAFFHHVHTDPNVAKSADTSDKNVSNGYEGGSGRLTIFVLDLLNTSFTEQHTALESLTKFLVKAIDIHEPICLIAIDASGLHVIHDFTSDPTVLAEALKGVKPQRSAKDTPGYDPAAVLGSGAYQRNRSAAVALEQRRLEVLNFASDVQNFGLVERVQVTLEALREIGEAFAGLPGRKSLIWATAGLPFNVDDVSSFAEHARYLVPAYENTWQALNRANIAVYPLDVEDLINPAYVSPSRNQPRAYHRFAEQTNISNLETFADITGGKFCDRRYDSERCFHDATEDSTDYYLLGYYENSENTKPGWRKLSVRVDRSDMHVRARSGYYVRGPHDEQGERKQDLELGLASPLDYTVLPVAVLFHGMTPENGKQRVSFSFHIPAGAATIDEPNGNHIDLDFIALARTPAGAPAGLFSQTLDGKLDPGTLAGVKAQGAMLPGTIDLPPGEYTLRFVVRDNLDGDMGALTAPLKVP